MITVIDTFTLRVPTIWAATSTWVLESHPRFDGEGGLALGHFGIVCLAD